MMRLSAIFTSTTLVAAHTDQCSSDCTAEMALPVNNADGELKQNPIVEDDMLNKIETNLLDSVTPEMAAEFDSVFAQLIEVLKAPADEMDWKDIIRETGMKPEQLLKEAKEVLADPSMFIDESPSAVDETPSEETTEKAAKDAEEAGQETQPSAEETTTVEKEEVAAPVEDDVPSATPEPTNPVDDVAPVPAATEDPLEAVTPEMAAELDSVFVQLIDVLKAPAEEMNWKEIVRETGMKPDELLKEAKEVLANPSLFDMDELDISEEASMPAVDTADASDEAISEKSDDGQEL